AVWVLPAVEAFWQDLRYATRTLRKSPGFALTAILSLALGIGANTAIFSLIDALLLRMLPVPNPQQLLELVTLSTENGEQFSSFAYPAITALQTRADRLSAICGFSGVSIVPAGPPGAVESASGVWATGNYYRTLGVKAELGRVLRPQDDDAASSPVAVLSYAYWENKLHRDPDILGKQILIDNARVTVIGVSAPGFDGANVGEREDITLPISALPKLFPEQAGTLASSSWWLRVLARTKPGISKNQAEAQLRALWPHLTNELVAPIRASDIREAILASRIALVPGGTGWSFLRTKFTRPLLVLFALVGLVLVIACVNVAN